MDSALVSYSMRDFKKRFIRDDVLHSEFERKRTRVYRRFGNIIRQEARRSLKRGPAFQKVKPGRKKKVIESQPGQPPLTRQSSEPNLRTILYGLDDDSLIAGPVGFKSTAGALTVPERHEFGGEDTISIYDDERERFVEVTASYPERPFMFPALERKSDQLGESIIAIGLV